MMYAKLPTGYITKSTIIILSTGVATYAGLELLTGSENFHKKLMPVVHKYIEGEPAHRLGVKMAAWNLLPPWGPNHIEYPELHCTVFGKELSNPIGLAAGFDKHGEAIGPLSRSGFGAVEIGSVTPIPQAGNPTPRVFRLIEDEGVINRYGFNSDGVGKVQQRVKKAWAARKPGDAFFGINLGKNKLTEDGRLDYEIGVTYMGPYCDYLVVNVSSPNTTGLRSLQKKEDLQKLMVTVQHALDLLEVNPRPKVLLKIAPDLRDDEKKDIANVALDKKYGIDGLIVANTTITRPEALKSELKKETGGLSGKPVKDLSTECVREMYKLTSGKIPIVGCGGVSTGADAYEKIRAGASLVQLYSALVYQGFPVIGKVKRELAELLRKDGYKNVSEAVGADHRKK